MAESKIASKHRRTEMILLLISLVCIALIIIEVGSNIAAELSRIQAAF